MIKQAVKELEAMQPRLLALADQIEESKRSSFFSFVKAIVKVVGLALAPFTGGASMAIASIADQALSVCEKVIHLDFKNLASGVQGLAEVVPAAANLGESTAVQFGGEDGQKLVEGFKSWVNDRKGDVNGITGEAKKFVDALKDVPLDALKPIAGALGSDFPVKVEGNTVRLEIGEKGLRLEGDLKAKFQQLLDHGGYVIGSLKSRLKLVGTDPYTAQQKEQLKQAVDDLVLAWPEDLLKKLNADVNAARTEFLNRKDQLKQYIDTADDKALGLVAQIFGGGLAIVQGRDGSIVAVERPITIEAEAFKRRIEAFKTKIKESAIGKLAESLEKRNQKLAKMVDDAQGSKDETQLRRIARVEIPREIEGVRNEIKRLDTEIELAKGQLQDAETGAVSAS